MNTKDDLYNRLRIIIGIGRNEIETGRASVLPKHPVTFKLLTNLYSEKEAELLVACFERCGEAFSTQQLADKADVSVSDLITVFNEMAYKGTLVKYGDDQFLLSPFVPSTSERYFIRRRDDPEKMKAVAKAQMELWDLGMLDELNRVGYPTFRVIPAIDPLKRTIALDEKIEPDHNVMPYEQLEYRIDEITPQKFVIIPCPCRKAAELAGNPCQVTSDDFCTIVGPYADFIIKNGDIVKEGIGREVNREEYLELMKRAEQLGLIHQTSNIQDGTMFICNCCSCCCPHVVSRKRLHSAGNVETSNFLPQIDRDECTLCEECVEVCPMNAMYHHWPHSEDGADEYIRVRSDICIGCGNCATVCPADAITLKKVSSKDPMPSYRELIDEFKNKIHH